MRIATWNVNGIRACWGNGLADYLQQVAPDLLAVQEVKCQPSALSEAIRKPPGYSTVWHCGERPGYSGVGMFIKDEIAAAGPWSVHGIGLPEIDREGRVLTLELPEFFYVTAYFPNSGLGGRRLEYKLAFCRAMEKFLGNLVRRGKPVMLAGDLNIAAEELDVFTNDSAAGVAGYLPPERRWLQGFLQGPWVDVFRRDHPGETGHYTWWSFFDDDRARNRGWRIDSFLVSQGLAPAVSCEIQAHVTGSDHCPVMATVQPDL